MISGAMVTALHQGSEGGIILSEDTLTVAQHAAYSQTSGTANDANAHRDEVKESAKNATRLLEIALEKLKEANAAVKDLQTRLKEVCLCV